MLKLTYIANYYDNIFNLYNQLKNLLLYRNVEYLLIIFNYNLIIEKIIKLYTSLL